ncbi:nephrin-like [Anticarsia gemmatalis]|uniref:nephrin-like n=1 Tax=Anticarsia gemmatalis TaxID=129554 RepID=UPI003F7704FB
MQKYDGVFHRMGMNVNHAMLTRLRGQHLLTLFSLLMVFECIISLELLELRVPAHVALGARAQLSCRWALSAADVLYSVKWYKDGKEFFRHVPRDSEPRRKFPLPGVDVEKSDASGSNLVLSHVVSESAGRYRCEVSGERPLFPTVSEHADMDVVVLPNHGPVITGLHTRYRLGDYVQVNCTSGRSRPPCHLSWYINGEPAPAIAVHPPVYTLYGDELQTTLLQLNFKITQQYFTKNGVKVKCLATLASLYWRSNEESALLERVKLYESLLPDVQKTNYKVDRVFSHTNHACYTSSTANVVGAVIILSLRLLNV